MAFTMCILFILFQSPSLNTFKSWFFLAFQDHSLWLAVLCVTAVIAVEPSGGQPQAFIASMVFKLCGAL